MRILKSFFLGKMPFSNNGSGTTFYYYSMDLRPNALAQFWIRVTQGSQHRFYFFFCLWLSVILFLMTPKASEFQRRSLCTAFLIGPSSINNGTMRVYVERCFNGGAMLEHYHASSFISIFGFGGAGTHQRISSGSWGIAKQRSDEVQLLLHPAILFTRCHGNLLQLHPDT